MADSDAKAPIGAVVFMAGRRLQQIDPEHLVYASTKPGRVVASARA